jgi:hypothetical protein
MPRLKPKSNPPPSCAKAKPTQKRTRIVAARTFKFLAIDASSHFATKYSTKIKYYNGNHDPDCPSRGITVPGCFL